MGRDGSHAVDTCDKKRKIRLQTNLLLADFMLFFYYEEMALGKKTNHHIFALIIREPKN
jgi:hypothetical protein